MKIKLLALSLFALMLSLTTQAQKIGHINRQVILELMPEAKNINTELDSLSRQKDAFYQKMVEKYNVKLKYYQDNVSKMGEAERLDMEEELLGDQKRITNYERNAQNELMVRRDELLKPILLKLDLAIQQVAKENAYSYILDSSSEIIVYSPEGSDITELVKKKMGLTTPVAPK